ncbi:hypothetical protein HF086_001705 [Spodoptera exigua]|uniref:Uncharacterized protein n=1 Tax=Spodoptera exigua TaxID=7107 RepID=A0A922SKE6_SPOEX|nr:hypothetical protein HF086_001705 [Spodoptera exigua]
MKLHVNTVHLKMPAPYKSQVLKDEQHYISPDIHYIKAEEGYKQEVEEAEILYEDVDSREITYEVVYEQ